LEAKRLAWAASAAAKNSWISCAGGTISSAAGSDGPVLCPARSDSRSLSSPCARLDGVVSRLNFPKPTGAERRQEHGGRRNSAGIARHKGRILQPLSVWAAPGVARRDIHHQDVIPASLLRRRDPKTKRKPRNSATSSAGDLGPFLNSNNSRVWLSLSLTNLCSVVGAAGVAPALTPQAQVHRRRRAGAAREPGREHRALLSCSAISSLRRRGRNRRLRLRRCHEQHAASQVDVAASAVPTSAHGGSRLPRRRPLPPRGDDLRDTAGRRRGPGPRPDADDLRNLDGGDLRACGPPALAHVLPHLTQRRGRRSPCPLACLSWPVPLSLFPLPQGHNACAALLPSAACAFGFYHNHTDTQPVGPPACAYKYKMPRPRGGDPDPTARTGPLSLTAPPPLAGWCRSGCSVAGGNGVLPTNGNVT
jgi:hypothetical protein